MMLFQLFFGGFMDISERQLLLCLSAYARGDKNAALADGFSVADIAELHSLAHIHKLTAVIYDKMTGVSELFSGANELSSAFRREAILESRAQCTKTAVLLKLTNAFENASVRYVIVKGVVCRELYSVPDARNSADEDIFILRDELDAAEAALTSLGFVKNGSDDADVVHWFERSSALHIELHFKLTSKLFDSLEPYFSDQIKRRISFPVGTSHVYTFAPTANLVFMVSHAQKHFIAGGFGIRTLCDTALFAVKHVEYIDKDELYEKLRSVNAVTFFHQLLAIARDYLSIDTSAWDISDVTAGEDLLDDILKAGIYGQSTRTRRHSSSLSVIAAEHGESASNLIRVIFPSADTISVRYPFVKKHPLLLPVGWIKRIADYSRELAHSKKGENSPKATVLLHKQRAELMKKYGITTDTKHR